MAYDPEFKAKYDRLAATGYMTIYENMIKAMCAPFWWSSRLDGQPAKIVGNGTVCFVNTGTRHIGVTNDHVYQGYLKAKEELPDVDCQFGGNTFLPERHLIDRSPETEFDLAIFDVSEVFVSASKGHYHHNALKWPPDAAEQGQTVWYGGYPQKLRDPGKVTEVDFYHQYFISRVTDIDAVRGVIIDPGLENLYWPGHEGQQINTDWGGHSGGPVFRVIDAGVAGQLVDRVDLVGFIYQKYMDFIFARPSGHINGDGTIRR